MKLIPSATSGTTGSGLKFLQTVTMENAQWAVWWRYRYRLEYLLIHGWGGLVVKLLLIEKSKTSFL